MREREREMGSEREREKEREEREYYMDLPTLLVSPMCTHLLVQPDCWTG